MELKPADLKDPAALLQMALRTEPGAVQRLSEEKPYYRPAKLLLGAMELAQGKEILSPLALYFNAEERELLYRVKVMISLSGRDHAAADVAPSAAPGTALLFPEITDVHEVKQPSTEIREPEEYNASEPLLGISADLNKPNEVEATVFVPSSEIPEIITAGTSKEIQTLSSEDSALNNILIEEWPEFNENNEPVSLPKTPNAGSITSEAPDTILLSENIDEEATQTAESPLDKTLDALPRGIEDANNSLRSFSDWLRLSGAARPRKPLPLPSLKPEKTEFSETTAASTGAGKRNLTAEDEIQSLEFGYRQEAVIAGLLNKEKSLTRDLEGFIDHQIRSKKKKKTGPERSGDGLPITESMAAVLLSQGKKERAVVMYRALSLKFPEKSGYFAALIKEIL